MTLLKETRPILLAEHSSEGKDKNLVLGTVPLVLNHQTVRKEILFTVLFIPGEGKDVVYEWGSIFSSQNSEICDQSVNKSIPAFFIIVDDVETCVPVV